MKTKKMIAVLALALAPLGSASAKCRGPGCGQIRVPIQYAPCAGPGCGEVRTPLDFVAQDAVHAARKQAKQNLEHVSNTPVELYRMLILVPYGSEGMGQEQDRQLERKLAYWEAMRNSLTRTALRLQAEMDELKKGEQTLGRAFDWIWKSGELDRIEMLRGGARMIVEDIKLDQAHLAQKEAIESPQDFLKRKREVFNRLDRLRPGLKAEK